jgi:diadenosine tetraphosphate (Ap4A) HIT family hydrolase
MSECVYCTTDAGEMIWHNESCRVILAPEPLYPGWCRVVWTKHVTELTDLSVADRTTLMEVVFAVEEGLRKLLNPKKVNAASLGTIVPHLHWHMIPRFVDDPTYPQPVWTTPVREVSAKKLPVDFISKMRNHLESQLKK